MPVSALGLALAAAVLHALWNLLLARSRDVLAATAASLCLSVVFFAPVAAVGWRVEHEAVPWIAASAALELAYFFALSAAYTRADLSLVYPVARGAAPLGGHPNRGGELLSCKHHISPAWRNGRAAPISFREELRRASTRRSGPCTERSRIRSSAAFPGPKSWLSR